jgi:predicted nucleic acid-binding protein
MRAVLDSSAGLAAVLPEPHQAKAIRLLDEYQNGIHDLLAPDIYPLETLNGLAKAERQKRITGAFVLWRSLLADAPTFHPHMQLMSRAYAISSSTLSAVYDCIYVALAEREACKMVTADDRLVKNLQGRFPFVIALSSLP